MQVMNDTEKSKDVDLTDLISAIWAGKWVVIFFTAIFSVGAVFFALNQPDIYKSEVLLSPSNSDAMGDAGRLGGQLGGLAAIAGVNLGSSDGANKTQMAIQILKSRKFIGDFVSKYEILPDLFAVESWDKANRQVIYNSEIYQKDSKKWVRESMPHGHQIPTLQEAYIEFMEVFNVLHDKDTGLVSISIEHPSPYIAKLWVDLLVEEINQEMKSRDVYEAQKSLDFLQKQISKTLVSDSRAVLYNLVEKQTKVIMFAEVRDEYAFKTIDPALVSELKYKPSRAVICIVGALLGSMLGLLIVIIRFFGVIKVHTSS
ncbi:hypothetical protein N473_05570 [Pseudoalteromonas luteoviolacea CPMOR-1]|uniref:Polysaccharide chain length determinant N-terminal domain-containing protein n=1 Tax=Pseudoalteromonas luteoviolacea CPMOR-1 TaxID=1365248 RepID=A0A167HJT0_9GAMM|nr:Wzz/FepE/Etk N-terminal domain-containing protein [Pseudoalteromonas luteoviolacea]KZN58211.1 hypothetical protein N473_05570 [Pseudoalteromonas luteoviolacea CPMOR-1]